MKKEQIYAQVSTKDNKKQYKAITCKQWQVYYYLLSISKYNSKEKEDHRYVYKNQLNVSAASKFLGMGRTTFYRALESLQKYRLVMSKEDYYLIYYKNYIAVDTTILQRLLSFSKNNNKNVDLLRIYLCLKHMNTFTEKEERCFTKRDLISILGHDVHTSEEYNSVRAHIAWLTYLSLIEIKAHTVTSESFGRYTVYHLQNVFDKTEHPDFYSDIEAEMNSSVLPKRVTDQLRFTMPEFDLSEE